MFALGRGGQEKANAAFACLNRHNLDVIPVTFIEYILTCMYVKFQKDWLITSPKSFTVGLFHLISYRFGL